MKNDESGISYIKWFVLICNVRNEDESSIRSGTKPRVLMEFPWKLAAARQCRICRKQLVSVSTSSVPSPSTSLIPVYLMHTRILYLRRTLLLFFSLLSFSRASRPSSFAARKIVSRDCQKYALRTHLSVRLHLSVRCRSQDDGGIAQHRRDDWKYSVAGFSRRVSKSSPMRHRAAWHAFSTCRTVRERR